MSPSQRPPSLTAPCSKSQSPAPRKHVNSSLQPNPSLERHTVDLVAMLGSRSVKKEARPRRAGAISDGQAQDKGSDEDASSSECVCARLPSEHTRCHRRCRCALTSSQPNT